jgi:hypothetical protein
MTEGHSCSAAICRRKCNGYNIHVKLEATHREKQGEHGIGVACAVQILDMMIHTILKSAQETQTNAAKTLECENYTPKV